MATNPLSLCEISPAYSLVVKCASRPHCMDYEVDHKSPMRCRKPFKGKSPYLHGADRISYHSRITEKRIIDKDLDGFGSSFPLASSLYRANSAEEESMQKIPKKVKKSVLTLPNKQVPMPHTCTVSDLLHDMEFRSENEINTTVKNSVPLLNRRKHAMPKVRDVQNYAQLKFKSDSTETLKQFEGDGNRRLRDRKKSATKEAYQPQDVWKVLREINRFQFKSTPPMSIESSVNSAKKKVVRKRNSRKVNRRLIETCRTEEISYIANFEFESKKAGSVSRSPSCVTVISNKNKRNKDTQKSSTNTRQLQRAVEKMIQKNLNDKVTIMNNMTGKKENFASHRTNVEKWEKEYDGKNSVKLSIDLSNHYGHMAAGEEPIDDEKNRINREHEANAVMDANKNACIQGPTCVKDVSYCNEAGVYRFQAGAPGSMVNKIVGSKANSSYGRSPRIVMQIPAAPTMAKVTVAELKKKLARIKFPLTVMDNHHVSSSFEVPDCDIFDTIQFKGLDKHIWPFMIEWRKKESERKQPLHLLQHNNNKHEVPNNSLLMTTKGLRKTDLSMSKRHKENKTFDHFAAEVKNTEKQQSDIQLNDANTMTANNPKEVNTKIKQKPNSCHLKYRMLNFMYKKSSDPHCITHYESHDDGGRQKYSESKTNVEVSTVHKVGTGKAIAIEDPRSESPPTRLHHVVETVGTHNKQTDFTKITSYKAKMRREPWSRGKLASDFIDNVIMKVKSGIYHNQESCLNIKSKKLGFVDQTDQSGDIDSAGSRDTKQQILISHKDIDDKFTKNDRVANCMAVVKAYDPLSVIPGFDEVLPGLEIKSSTTDQISVKHCMTNILMQFNIKIISDAVLPQVGVESRCIPLKITDSHTRVFKYNGTILNAVLPAQLCFLLPRLIRDQNIAGNTMNSSLQRFKNPSLHLSMPPTGGHCRNLGSNDVQLPNCRNLGSNDVQLPMQMFEYMSLALKHLLRGRFSDKPLCQIQIITNVARPIVKDGYKIPQIAQMLRVIPQKITGCVIYPHVSTKAIKPKDVSEMYQPCTALVPYNEAKPRIAVPTYYRNLVNRLMSYSNSTLKFLLPSFIGSIKLKCYNNTMIFDMVFEKQHIKTDMSGTTLGHVKLNSLFNGLVSKPATRQLTRKESDLSKENKTRKSDPSKESLSQKCIECIKAYRTGKIVRQDMVPKRPKSKCRRLPYVKLYKKCKSTTYIDKSRWSLNNMTTTDSFFQWLGSSKTWMSVFDDAAEEKIQSALCQMKRWTKEISARQALLIILLINKETPDLTRFRCLLLQGIAKNRITTVTELDVEISVIRNEYPSLEPYNGTPKSLVPLENESLFEELRWIAKTTAADHNRPFDEMSEKLLKSLLENRKKNPSYLRVMARYVGLGLVKTPSKTQN